MPSGVIAFFRPKKRLADWSPEEIAELYRIEHALLQARFSLETDRGISDEGDPWFVFCRADGEVLVHIVRSDNEYELHSPGLAQPLKGRFISELSKAFVGQLPLQVFVRRPGETRLFVHPAAALAILIGAIFVAYDVVQLDAEQGADADEGDTQSGQPVGKSALQVAFSKFAEAVLGTGRIDVVGREAPYLNVACVVAAAIGTTLLSADGIWGASPNIGGDESEEASLTHASATKGASDPALSLLDHLMKIDESLDSNAAMVPSLVEEQNSAHASTTSGGAIVKYQHATPLDVELEIVDVTRKAATEIDLFQDTQHAWGHPVRAESANVDLASGHVLGVAANASVRNFAAGLGKDLAASADHQVANSPHDGGSLSIEQFLQNVLKWSPTPATQNEVVVAAQIEATSVAVLPPASDFPGAPEKVETTSRSGLYPLFDSSAQEALVRFLNHNANAQVIFDHGSIIVYDGVKDFASSPVTVQVWEFDTGERFALVGHADHPAVEYA